MDNMRKQYTCGGQIVRCTPAFAAAWNAGDAPTDLGQHLDMLIDERPDWSYVRNGEVVCPQPLPVDVWRPVTDELYARYLDGHAIVDTTT